jgi:uncharacterized membrane protein
MHRHKQICIHTRVLPLRARPIWQWHIATSSSKLYAAINGMHDCLQLCAAINGLFDSFSFCATINGTLALMKTTPSFL